MSMIIGIERLFSDSLLTELERLGIGGMIDDTNDVIVDAWCYVSAGMRTVDLGEADGSWADGSWFIGIFLMNTEGDSSIFNSKWNFIKGVPVDISDPGFPNKYAKKIAAGIDQFIKVKFS